MFGDERSVLRLLPHVLRRRAGRTAPRTPARAARPRARAHAGARHRARDRADARGRLSTAPRGASSIKHDGHARTVDVRIPAGVGDGSRVRVAGEGEPGAGGAPSAISTCASGSRRIRCSSARATTSTRASRVPVTTAVLGGEAEVPTLGGKSLRLKIPPTTQNGQVFRLKGHGMPAVGKPDEHGDLYATVDVAAAAAR